MRVVYANTFGVTVEDIIKRTGHHRVTVQKYVSLLEDMGFIVTHKIGYYTIVFPSGLAEYLENDFPSILMDSLIYVLKNRMSMNIDEVYNFSRSIALLFSQRIMHVIKWHLKKVHKYTKYLTNIYIPAVIPTLRFKVSSFRSSDKLIYIELQGIKAQNAPKEYYCAFLKGYVEGVLLSMDAPLRSLGVVEAVEKKDGLSCVFIAILKEPISKVLERLVEEDKPSYECPTNAVIDT